MASLRRWVTALRDVGVAGQDFPVVRRIRTINIVAILAAILTLGYCILYAAYDWRHFAIEIPLLMVFSALYSIVLLITHRGSPTTAMWWLVMLAVVHLGTIGWLLGPTSGAQNYLLITPFILSLLIAEDDRMSVWPIAIAVCAIFAIVTLSQHQGSVDNRPERFRLGLFVANIFGAVLLATGIGLLFRWLIQKAEAELVLERARSDRLLRAILPDPIAERLKVDPCDVIADRFDEATVLFADIVGFTRRSAEIDADSVVEELNDIFGQLDQLAEKRGIEKIKTIGDAYFAVSGVPNFLSDHATRMADFALDVQSLANDWQSPIWPKLQFRIAIHAGPVVAGVIGRSKFAYDVWGDTVNTASRLEERCEPGMILITETVAQSLPERFVTHRLDAVDLRDKGMLEVRGLSTGNRALG